MKKLLILNSVFDPVTENSLAKLLLERFLVYSSEEQRRDIKIELYEDAIAEDFPSKIIPRGFDVYLIHPSDIELEDLVNLRTEQPKSRLYCMNRQPVLLEEDEKNVYDKIYPFLDQTKIEEILKSTLELTK